MGVSLVSFILVFQIIAIDPQLDSSNYLLLREGEQAPFAGVLLLEPEYRELKLKETELILKEKDLKIANERFEASEKSYLEMKTAAEECAVELEEISDESPAWYESVEFWIGAVVGAGLTIATVLAVDELK